jgi:hypothetical protein
MGEPNHVPVLEERPRRRRAFPVFIFARLTPSSSEGFNQGVQESRDLIMIEVTARFTLWELPTLLMAPDSLNDNWDKYSHPTEDLKAIFRFKDSEWGLWEFCVGCACIS